MPHKIDHSFALAHRRLRSLFRMETIERHETRVMAAIEKRIADQRAAS